MKAARLALVFLIGFAWLHAFGEENNNKGRGLKEPTAQQRAWMAKHFPRVQRVLPNKLALERFNAEQRARGLAPAAVLPKDLPDIGRELVFSATAGSSAGAGQGTAGTIARGALTPSAADNSTSAAFPPIGDQASLGACAAWSTTYYQFTYETALARGLTASGGDTAVLFSPKWTYNMTNGGEDAGATFPDVFLLLTKNGACRWAELPYDNNYLAWCLSTAAWRNALQFRPADQGTITDANPDTFIADMKTQLANGHVLTFGTYVDSWTQSTIAGGSHKGEQAAIWADFYNSGAHAMTIVGYDDNVWCDLNGDGKVDPGEMGALKIANSWGTSDWNNGFRWVAYDAVRPTSTVPKTATWPPAERSPDGLIWDMSAFTVTAKGSYTPSLVAEFTLSTARRDEMGIILGLGDTKDVAPTTTWVSGAFNQQGGSYAFNGTTTAVAAIFCLDFTDLNPPPNKAKRYFLGAVDTTTKNPLTVSTYRLTTAAGKALGTCSQLPKTLDNNGAWYYIDFTLPSSIPPQITDAKATPSPVLGTTSTLTVTATDDDGEPNLTYTWSVVTTPASGTVGFSPNGSNAAKSSTATFSRAGAYVLRVTAKDQTELTDTRDVALTVNATTTTITVAPSNAAVTVNDTRLFAATAYDQFGQAMAPQPSFTWSVTGGGTIGGTGLFQAGDTPGGPYTVTASAAGVDGTATVTVKAPGSNTPPVANDDAYTVAQDDILTVDAPGVLTNDTDADAGDTLAAVPDSGPWNGSLTLNGDGSFTYTPVPGFNGTDIFTYRANDGTDNSAAALVVITVTAPVHTNQAPVAVGEAYSVEHDTTLDVDAASGVLANDTDADGDPLTAVPDAGPWNGSLTLAEDGSFSYTPNPGFHGVDMFTYLAYDGTDYSDPALVTIAVNTPPVAADDAYTVDYGKTLTVNAPGILANDTDADNDPLTAVKGLGPWNGTLNLLANGGFTYTPNKGFHGNDVFTYKANDGIDDSSSATVTITVKAPNTPPVAVDDAYKVETGKTLTVAAPGILVNDTDAEKDPLTSVKVDGPWNGKLALNANGSFTYTPEPGFLGTDLFRYKASDGKDFSSPATVRITVTPPDQAPVAVDDAYSVDRDQTLTVPAPGVLGNDTDPDGDPITAKLAKGPTQGALTFNADGSFTYTPKKGYTGPDSFTYKANDGQLDSAAATVTLTVTLPVNTPPDAVNDAYTMVENTTLTVDAASGVLANDTDAQGDPLTATQGIGPWNGALAFNADGSFTYTPNPGYIGTDAFTYTANDGQADSLPATVVITVTRFNHPPVANDDAYTVAQDGFLDVSAPGLLANDTDADGDPIQGAYYTGAAHGNVAVYTDGSFTYIPDAGYSGPDKFTYNVTDGMAESNFATVTITVDATPVANDDQYTTGQDTDLVVDAASGVLANDTDAENDPLTAVLDFGPLNGTLALNDDGSFTYTPDPGFHGTDMFFYYVDDGFSQSYDATVTITVVAAPELPDAVDDSYSVQQDTTLTVDAASGVLANDSDPQGLPLTAVADAGPYNGTLNLNADGSFDYTPNPGYVGTDTFTYVANNGTDDSFPATVVIDVNPLTNTPPDAADDSYTVQQDTTLTVDAASGVLANDSDADGDTLTATLEGGPWNGTINFNDDGSFDYTPDPGFTGTDLFTYVANDGQADSNVATVTIDVTPPANTPPDAADDSYTVQQDITLTIDAFSGILANDTDAEGDPLTAVLDAGPYNGTLNLNDDGSFDYTPNPAFVGTDTFTYHANDGQADSATATVTIDVTARTVGTNTTYTAPQAWGHKHASHHHDNCNHPGARILKVKAPGVLTKANDPDPATLQATVVDSPANGIVKMLPDGSFRYKPTRNFIGTDTFTFTTNRDGAQATPATVTIEVKPIVGIKKMKVYRRAEIANGKATGNWYAVGGIRVRCVNRERVFGATVTGHWSGAYAGTFTGTTSASGGIRWQTPALTGPGTVTFTIDSIVPIGQPAIVRGPTTRSVTHP